MSTNPIRRPSHIRPLLDRRKTQRHSRLRTTDLPAIATALGITVTDLVDTARRVAG